MLLKVVSFTKRSQRLKGRVNPTQLCLSLPLMLIPPTPPPGRARVLDCLAPWLCLSPPRPLGSAGPPPDHAAPPQNAAPPHGWLTPPLRHHTSTTPSEGSGAPSSDALHRQQAAMVKTFQVWGGGCLCLLCYL